jgi:hypothetical protein
VYEFPKHIIQEVRLPITTPLKPIQELIDKEVSKNNNKIEITPNIYKDCHLYGGHGIIKVKPRMEIEITQTNIKLLTLNYQDNNDADLQELIVKHNPLLEHINIPTSYWGNLWYLTLEDNVKLNSENIKKLAESTLGAFRLNQCGIKNISINRGHKSLTETTVTRPFNGYLELKNNFLTKNGAVSYPYDKDTLYLSFLITDGAAIVKTKNIDLSNNNISKFFLGAPKRYDDELDRFNFSELEEINLQNNSLISVKINFVYWYNTV